MPLNLLSLVEFGLVVMLNYIFKSECILTMLLFSFGKGRATGLAFEVKLIS